MRLLARTNDPVLVSFIEALLRESQINHYTADANMSVLEGSIGILPRRILVADESWEGAASLLEAAELGQWVVRDEMGGA